VGVLEGSFMTIVQYWRSLQIHLYSTHLRHWRPTWDRRQTFPYSTSLRHVLDNICTAVIRACLRCLTPRPTQQFGSPQRRRPAACMAVEVMIWTRTLLRMGICVLRLANWKKHDNAHTQLDRSYRPYSWLSWMDEHEHEFIQPQQQQCRWCALCSSI